MRCLVRLTDDTVFLAKKSWYDWLLELPHCFVFRDIQGSKAPAHNAKDRLHVPKTSILYILEERR